MKTKLCSIAFILCSHVSIYAQSGQWTWMKGDSTIGSAGSYGIKGITVPTNEPPARFSPAFWTDTAGNFWMYGGSTSDSSYSNLDFWDMWKFDPVTVMWTWMNGDTVNIHDSLIPLSGMNSRYYDREAVITAPKGIYSAQNSPGSIGYGVPAWVTSDNHLWFYAGELFDTIDYQSNLWQFDPLINQWAWMGNFGMGKYGIKGMGDSTTMPGGRGGANCSWVDGSENLWFFGCADATNDMWKYDVTSGIWTWMSGSKNGYDTGVYTIKGIPSINNYPWSRNNNFFWKDNIGNFWLIGGLTGTGARMRDIWKFNPQTLEWRWIGGPSTTDRFNTAHPFGNTCDSSYLNDAGDRYGNSTVWKICDDLIINYGAATNDTGATITTTNDVWGYLPSLNEWIKLADVPYIGYYSYGLQGVSNSANYPPTRFNAAGFVDKTGGLWTFGGQNSNYFTFNDLWKFTIDTACLPVVVCNLKTAINEVPAYTIGVSISPNPATDFSTLTVSEPVQNLGATLFDIAGRKVMTFKITNPTTQIPITTLPAGLYFVKVSGAAGNIGVGKLIKQR